MTSNPRPTLAAVAICRNEIRDIAGFLANVAPLVDEIIVVDDGSTDGTLDVLRQAGPKVKVVERRREEVGGFDGLRNAGIDAATADWLLHMDIDERITPELAEEIGQTLPGSTLNAYRYRRLNFFLHRPFRAGGYETWNHPNLARRGRHRFLNAVHETTAVDGGPAATGQLRSQMWHLNDESFRERIDKNASYAVLTADGLAGVKVRWWHLVSVPAYRAAKAYLARGAWRYGELGLLFSLHVFSGTFNAFAVAWDRQNSVARDSLERELRSRHGDERS